MNKILETARKLSYPKGTNKNKYSYKHGDPSDNFKKVFNKVFPTHKKWGPAPSKGASCDVFAATVVRASGLDKKMPRGYDEQIKHHPSKKMVKLVYYNKSPYSVSKPGDMILYTKNKSGSKRHVLIRGSNCVYEAQYAKTYGHVTGVKKIKKKRPKVVIFRAKK